MHSPLNYRKRSFSDGGRILFSTIFGIQCTILQRIRCMIYLFDGELFLAPGFENGSLEAIVDITEVKLVSIVARALPAFPIRKKCQVYC